MNIGLIKSESARHNSLFKLIVMLVLILASSSSVIAMQLQGSLAPDRSSQPGPDVSSLFSRNTVVNIDSVIGNMTLREKIGQLFVIPANGRFVSEDDRRFKDLVHMVEEMHVGGIIFMQGDVFGQGVLTNKLQQRSRIPLWITQDTEYGVAMRVRGATRFTPAMGIAATGDVNNAYLAGKITAQEAKALGVHQIFAPVLDVNNNPENPVINVRSFSADPNMVSQYGNAFIAGVESEGIVSTAKHFPGHGDTDTDSHLELPVVDHDYARLSNVELIPFQSAIDKGLSSIMSAHIALPNVSDEEGLPSTLDATILQEILKDSLEFDGVIVTDGLEMNGITSKFSPGRAVVKALQAGADIMLISPDVETAIHEVEDAIHKGILTESRLETSVRKMLEWKQAYGTFERQPVDVENLTREIDRSEYQAVAEKIARESVTVLKNRNNILPIDAAKYPKVMVLSVADDETGETGSNLARYVRNFHPDVTFRVLDKRSTWQEKNKILADAKKADLIIIGSFIFLRSSQTIQLDKSHLALLRQIQNMKQPTVLVSFGNPYVLKDLSKSSVHVLSWSANDLQVKSTVPALFGAAEVKGKLPINIPGLYDFGAGINMKHTALRSGLAASVGMSSDSLRKIDRIVNKAIQDSVFPGAVVAVVKDGVVTYEKGFGYHDYDKTKIVRSSNVYDIASITKVVATTAATMRLIDQEKLSLDDKVSKYIREFDTKEKKNITIRDILLHQSGLPPFKVYVDKLKTRKEIIEAIKKEPLEYEPGTKYVYSDLGMIMLAEIIHKVSGDRLDIFTRKELHFPLGMYSTFFNPHRLGGWMRQRIPPTEIDTVYDRGLVKANVHDERAYFMDGIAGHAGLFSNARDLAKFAVMLLNEGTYAGKEYFKPETVRLFTTKQSDLSGRGLGFDRKSEAGFTSAGQLASNDTFGHLGFTGTSLWIDRNKNMAVILLTNRTYPKRSYGKRISRIRAAVADAAFSSIVEYQ